MTAEDFEGLRSDVIEHVWPPRLPWNEFTAPGGITIFVEGKGCRITDVRGKTYLDFFSCFQCNDVGYGRRELADVAREQMAKLHLSPQHEPSLPKIRLAKKLAEITPGSLSRAYFTTGGTEAIETALKMVKKYQRNLGFPGRYKLIGECTFHGMTYGAMSTGWRKGAFTFEDYEPLVPGMVFISPPYCATCELGLKYPSCDLACAKQVEAFIQRENPETIAGFIGTPIVLQAHFPPKEYWPMIRAICDKYGIPLIFDEIQSGFGRWGTMFACEHYDVVPDIMCVAKGITSGYMPLGATITTKEFAQKFEGGPKEKLMHGFTYEGHPVSCAVALAHLEILEREKLVENSAKMGRYLYEQVQSFDRHSIVGDIRGGLGLVCAIDLVKNKKTKERFGAQENRIIASLLKKKLMALGLYGPFTNPIVIQPPLIVTKDEIDEIVQGFDTVIGEIGKELSIPHKS